MRARKFKRVGWTWMGVADVTAAYRWELDYVRSGKTSVANDNERVLWNGAWTHRAELESVKAYWRKHGWKPKGQR